MADKNYLVILLCGIVCAGMTIDMGGPINKATHYAVVGVLTTVLKDPSHTTADLFIPEQLMSANLLGMMVPPVSIALATWLFPQKFTKGDRTASPANLIMGCCGITEGAIPYVVRGPVRVMGTSVTAGFLGGCLCGLFNGVAIAPEGGVISYLVMGEPIWRSLLAMLISCVFGAFMLGALKKKVPSEYALLKK